MDVRFVPPCLAAIVVSVVCVCIDVDDTQVALLISLGAIVYAALLGHIGLDLILGLMSMSWPSAPGVISECWFDSWERSDEEDEEQLGVIVVRYSYRVGKRRYSGRMIRYGQTPQLGRGDPEARSPIWQCGMEVPVYYCPAFPRLAVLERGLHRSSITTDILGALLVTS